MKWCWKCRSHKPFDAFAKCKSRFDGLDAQCRECTRAWRQQPHRKKYERERSRKRRLADKDGINADARRRYDPVKEAVRRSKKDKNQKRKSSQKWRDNNRDLANAFSAEWKRSNPEKVLSYCHARRARKALSGGTYTVADIAAMKKRQKNKCASSWCRTSIKDGYHVDHIVPIARGGSNDRKNLQLLCKSCNLQKHAKHPIDFAQQHGMLL